MPMYVMYGYCFLDCSFSFTHTLRRLLLACCHVLFFLHKIECVVQMLQFFGKWINVEHFYSCSSTLIKIKLTSDKNGFNRKFSSNVCHEMLPDIPIWIKLNRCNFISVESLRTISSAWLANTYFRFTKAQLLPTV